MDLDTRNIKVGTKGTMLIQGLTHSTGDDNLVNQSTEDQLTLSLVSHLALDKIGHTKVQYYWS